MDNQPHPNEKPKTQRLQTRQESNSTRPTERANTTRIPYGGNIMRGIHVTVEDLRDALQPYLDHSPSIEQLENFIDYVRNDIYEWLRDNAKSFVRDE